MSDPVVRPRWFTETKEGHSQWYVDRFRALAEEGADLLGEARFADTLVARGSRVLDAGCGAGRMAGALAAAGHTVVGLDADPVLIDAARTDHPGPSYAVCDLSTMTLADVGDEPVDLTVCAGNVMVFVAPGTEREVLTRLCSVTRAGGRVVVGFRRDDAYPFATFDIDLAALAEAGVAQVEQRFSTWHLDPFTADADFAVTVLRVG
jgi:2-polyprenyl-3-methyl-5-hydroxy-6-metoxy-1,4-benzoquinol methylase